MLHFCASTAQMGRKVCLRLVLSRVIALGCGLAGVKAIFGMSWRPVGDWSFLGKLSACRNLITTAGRAAWQDPSTARGSGGQQGSFQAAGAEWAKKEIPSWSCCSWAGWAAGTMMGREVLREGRGWWLWKTGLRYEILEMRSERTR